MARKEKSRGQVVRKATPHGHYLEYVPKAAPDRVLVIVHGTLDKEKPQRDEDVFIKRWTDVAEQRRLLLLAPQFDQPNFGGAERPSGGRAGGE